VAAEATFELEGGGKGVSFVILKRIIIKSHLQAPILSVDQINQLIYFNDQR
jgi:hypothetical protein